MFVYKKLKIKKIHQNSVVAIGNFDGVHLGHQKVLKEAKAKAKKNNLKFGLITFEPIPTLFFNKNIKNHRLNSLIQKKELLKKFKLDFLIIINFNKSFSNISAENFIKKILIQKIKAKFIFVSKNFKFGKNRSGNTNTLKQNEKKYLYKTIITNPLKKKNKVISSTLIRKNLSYGKLSLVSKLLGRPWCVEGEVVKGFQRGRKIGFPTCNIKLKDYILPKYGVYAVTVQSEKFKGKRKGIANLGIRPTFNGKLPLLEVNIFGINANLYKKILKVNFIKFIRKEKKFENIQSLKKQIQKDIIKAR